MYRSPESLKDNTKTADIPADVYSLGVILYQIITDKLPYEKDTLSETVDAIIKGDFISPESILPDAGIDPTLSFLCRRTLDKDPGNRPTAKYFSDMLDRFIHNEREWEVIDFGRNNLKPEDWVPLTGKWEFTGEEWITCSTRENILLWKYDVIGGFHFSCEGFFEEKGEFSIIARAPAFQSENNYGGYFFQVGAEGGFVTKFVRNEQDILVKINITPEKGKKYRVEIEYDEEWIYCYFDGKRIFQYRELFPFAGRYIGFGAWGKGTHLKPIRLKRQTWGLTLPAIKLADELMYHKTYEIALMQYRRIADSNKYRLEGKEALLKSGICLAKLSKIEEARQIFESLRGSVMEPFALVEEGRMELRNSADNNPCKSVKLFAEMIRNFPNSQAKANIMETVAALSLSDWLTPDSSREDDLKVRIDLWKIARDAYGVSTISTISYGVEVCCNMFWAGRWKDAYDDILNIYKTLSAEQRNIHDIGNYVALSSLALGKEDLLLNPEFITQNVKNGKVRTAFIYTLIIKNKCREFISNIIDFRNELREGKELNSAAKSFTLECMYALKDIESAKHWIQKEINSTNDKYNILEALLQSGQEELFKNIVKECLNDSSINNEERLFVEFCKTRWEIEHLNFKKASEGFKGVQYCGLRSINTTGSVVLQSLLFSLGYLESVRIDKVEEDINKYLGGPELHLARIFLGHEYPEPNDKWPHPKYNSYLRLWLALWLEAGGDKKTALKIVTPAIDSRYGLSNSQPALEDLIKRCTC